MVNDLFIVKVRIAIAKLQLLIYAATDDGNLVDLCIDRYGQVQMTVSDPKVQHRITCD